MLVSFRVIEAVKEDAAAHSTVASQVVLQPQDLFRLPAPGFLAPPQSQSAAAGEPWPLAWVLGLLDPPGLAPPHKQVRGPGLLTEGSGPLWRQQLRRILLPVST